MITDRLWGGTLEALSLDAPAQVIALSISVSSGDKLRSSELRFSGVSQFHFFNEIDGPWDYAEVTELRVEKDRSSGQWTFNIVLWSEDAGMSGKCASIALDGIELRTGL